MLLVRGSNVPPLIRYSIGIVCLCVVMYMLGSMMTLWTMEFGVDQTDSPLLEGFSVPTTSVNLKPAMPVSSIGEIPSRLKTRLSEHHLLRPPNPAA